MRRLLFLLFSAISLTGSAQGVNFDQEHSWEDIKRRASAENKYILLDCFASWCAPCQQMNTEVFSRKDVGDFLNEKFISVKVQLDKTGKDNEYVKSWYDAVAMIQKEYGVVSLPTFSFFHQTGNLFTAFPERMMQPLLLP